MKRKLIFSVCACLLLIIAGVLLSGYLNFLGGILLFTGLAGLLASCLYAAQKSNGTTCPSCGTRIYSTTSVAVRQRDGLFPCPKCGTLIAVAHTKK